MIKAYRQFSFITLGLIFWGLLIPPMVMAQSQSEPVPFVVQLTRSDDNYGHRRVFLQIDKVLDEIGEDKLNITVVAYEEGIKALLANNDKTSQLLTKLANRGVTFKACRISMKSWGLTDEQFPLEVEFVPSGAPEMIRLQMLGYKYWRP
ncbi:DsrE family protein [Thiomicrorhabdus arctica]|uniref:DsrE family protein n=1 Tax=Thiomicrorhabdus arctica TaxID=131540 RepID=UPI0003760888|nr:DsrE family protein [Thiomicrorhabdus arctica]